MIDPSVIDAALAKCEMGPEEKATLSAIIAHCAQKRSAALALHHLLNAHNRGLLEPEIVLPLEGLFLEQMRQEYEQRLSQAKAPVDVPGQEAFDFDA